jgi:hypothetical protein
MVFLYQILRSGMLNKILHISISILLVTVTTGITINKHYSGGKLYSFSITGKAQSCCETDCNCCENSVDTYRLAADYLMSTNNCHSENTVLNICDLFYFVEQDNYYISQFQPVSITNHSLPLPVPDIRAQLQSFLL